MPPLSPPISQIAYPSTLIPIWFGSPACSEGTGHKRRRASPLYLSHTQYLCLSILKFLCRQTSSSNGDMSALDVTTIYYPCTPTPSSISHSSLSFPSIYIYTCIISLYNFLCTESFCSALIIPPFLLHSTLISPLRSSYSASIYSSRSTPLRSTLSHLIFLHLAPLRFDRLCAFPSDQLFRLLSS